MYFSLILMLFLSTGFKGLHVQGSPSPVVTHLGATVLLPCFTQSPLPLEGLEVEWRKKDSESLVNIFQQGESRPELQTEVFRGRVHFFPDEIAKGNFSILMKNVGQNDFGIYSCKIITSQNSREIVVEIKDFENLVVKGADHTVSASVGDEVILNCSVYSHIHEIEEVTWKRTDQDLLILLYQDSRIFSDASHESYQGRAEFFVKEIPRGNFSLKLKDVRTEDKGEYTCKVYTGNLTAHTVVVLQSLGFSKLHILILLLCITALLLAVGLGVPMFILLLKKDINDKITKMNTFLILCPNICMSAAFMLWYKEGHLTEVVICSTVSIIRPIMLIKTSPDLKYPKLLSNKVKTFAVPVYFSFIAVAVCSTLFYNNPPQRPVDHIFTVLAADVFVLCSGAFILAYYAFRVLLAMCLEVCLGVQVGSVLLQGRGNVDTDILAYTALVLVGFMALVFLSLQRHCFLGKDFECRDISLISIFVALCCLGTLVIYILLIMDLGNPSIAWELPLQVFIYIIGWVAVVLVLRWNRRHGQRCCSQQRGKGYLLCAVIIALLMTAYGALCLYFIKKHKKHHKENSDYMALTALIQVVVATSLFKHPKDLPKLPHIITYMFGASGVNVVNSITLATELNLKAGNGARVIEPLSVIVLPCETLFASGWLALQIYNAWARMKPRIENNFEDQQEHPPQGHEMEVLRPS